MEKQFLNQKTKNINIYVQDQNKKYCDPSACTRHICGITPQQASELVGAEEALGQITQYCSDPPIFYESVVVKTNDKGGHKRIE